MKTIKYWDELEKIGDCDFQLTFYNENDNYVSEIWSRHLGETFNEAAERICKRFGWDKIKPGSEYNSPKKEIRLFSEDHFDGYDCQHGTHIVNIPHGQSVKLCDKCYEEYTKGV